MKHCSHIYVASKAIEFMYAALGNMKDQGGGTMSSVARTKTKASGKKLQRLLQYHKDAITEASWAPDDILNDKSLYHTFKLFTEIDFPGRSSYAKETHTRDGKTYYRIAQGGGLPYKVDHLARVIADMAKLRAYNDGYSMRQIMYQLLLLSHYVTDAHVPMHCDIRDDPPGANDTTKPPDLNRYYSDELHGEIEQTWEDAVVPVALQEEIVLPLDPSYSDTPTPLSPSVAIQVTKNDDVKRIVPVAVSDRGLMDYMLGVCIKTKERSLTLFPPDNPTNWNQALLPQMTKEIFAEAVGTLISIWVWIWMAANKGEATE